MTEDEKREEKIKRESEKEEKEETYATQ